MRAKDHARVWIAAANAMEESAEESFDNPSDLRAILAVTGLAAAVGVAYEVFAKKQEEQDG